MIWSIVHIVGCFWFGTAFGWWRRDPLPLSFGKFWRAVTWLPFTLRNIIADWRA